jgi:hypothetical protein
MHKVIMQVLSLTIKHYLFVEGNVACANYLS